MEQFNTGQSELDQFGPGKSAEPIQLDQFIGLNTSWSHRTSQRRLLAHVSHWHSTTARGKQWTQRGVVPPTSRPQGASFVTPMGGAHLPMLCAEVFLDFKRCLDVRLIQLKIGYINVTLRDKNITAWRDCLYLLSLGVTMSHCDISLSCHSINDKCTAQCVSVHVCVCVCVCVPAWRMEKLIFMDRRSQCPLWIVLLQWLTAVHLLQWSERTVAVFDQCYCSV